MLLRWQWNKEGLQVCLLKYTLLINALLLHVQRGWGAAWVEERRGRELGKRRGGVVVLGRVGGGVLMRPTTGIGSS